MWLILLPLIIATAAFWLLLVFLGWRAIKAARKSNFLASGICVTLIAIPFMFFATQRISANVREADRNVLVANFETISMPTRYPRLLEIYGFITERELMIYLDVLEIDEIIMFQSRTNKEGIRGQFIQLLDKCIGKGRVHFDAWQRRGKLGYATQEDKDCLTYRWSRVPVDRTNVPAVVFMHGTKSTLTQSGNNWANGAFEARLRTTNGDNLLSYWERPYITRPSSPSPWGYGFPSNTDSKKYRAPKRLDFFLNAVGLKK